jgi:plasmid stabilization system protein ParE
MARVVVTELAKRDVRRILGDLHERAGLRVATRYATAFKTAYRRLAAIPAAGPPRPALGLATRIAVVPPYIIVYDHAGDEVMVLRVLHGKRNITRDLVR